MDFSSSSSDDELSRQLQRNHRQRAKRRARDEKAITTHADPLAASNSNTVVVDGICVEIKAGTIFDLDKCAFVPVLAAQSCAARYFGEPTKKRSRRAFVDSRCIYVRRITATEVPQVARRLLPVCLAEADPRHSYVFSCETSLVPSTEETAKGSETRSGSPVTLAADASPYESVTHSVRCWQLSRRLGRLCDAPVRVASRQCAQVYQSMTPVNWTEGRKPVQPPTAERIGSVCGSDGRGLVAAIGNETVVFAVPRRGCCPSLDISRTCEETLHRRVVRAVFGKQVALLLIPSESRHGPMLYLFESESSCMITFLASRRTARLVPDAIAIRGCTDAVMPSLDNGSPFCDALVVHDRTVTILSASLLESRTVPVPECSSGKVTAVAGFERNAAGACRRSSEGSIIVCGSRNGALLLLADDPRIRRANAFLGKLCPPGGASIQEIIVRGPASFLSIDHHGQCRLWDVRRSEPTHPVLSFQPSAVPTGAGSRSVAFGCSIASHRGWVAVSASFGQAKVFDANTGRVVCAVEHESIGRSASLALVTAPSYSDLVGSWGSCGEKPDSVWLMACQRGVLWCSEDLCD